MQKEKLDLIISVLAASLFVLLLVVAAFMLFRIYLKRKNKLLLEKERMKIEFEQTLLQSQLEIQEQTFNYVSGELHDNIGQVLSLVRLNLNTLQAPAETDKINLMDSLMEKVIMDLRNLSHSLDTDHIRNNGWAEPVRNLLQNLQNTGKYTTHIELGNDLPTLGNEKPIILFRMIQEVINNIIRHAAADKIFFKAQKQNDELVITIEDNGKGFNNRNISEGAGLRNLESRSKMINAGLAINSEPGKGTLVTILVKTETIE
jgi:signal transduction histidine kinase